MECHYYGDHSARLLLPHYPHLDDPLLKLSSMSDSQGSCTALGTIAHSKGFLTYLYFHLFVYPGFPSGLSKLCSVYPVRGIATYHYVTWERTEALQHGAGGLRPGLAGLTACHFLLVSPRSCYGVSWKATLACLAWAPPMACSLISFVLSHYNSCQLIPLLGTSSSLALALGETLQSLSSFAAT